MKKYLLAVDAGNSKTLALAADSDGAILGWGRGGSGDIYRSEAAALYQVEAAVQAALERAQLRPAQLTVSCFSMVGADWPEDFAFWESEIRRRHFGRTTLVVNDALGALRAGSRDGTGVAVVVGTGAAIGARSPTGRVWHSSFWQEPQGGRELGEKALRAVYRSALDIDESTSLTERVLTYFGATSVTDVLHQVTSRSSRGSDKIRGLARVLLDEAEKGDAKARAIVEAHGTALGDYALAAARKVDLIQCPFTLVLAGGVLRHSSQCLSRAIGQHVQNHAPYVRVVKAKVEPVVGALFLSFELLGRHVDQALMERIAVSLPEPIFFETGA